VLRDVVSGQWRLEALLSSNEERFPVSEEAGSSPAVVESRGNISRRDLVRTSLVGAVTIGAGSILAACGGSSTATSTAGGTPKRGGTIRAGLTGGSTSDTLDPMIPLTLPDYARLSQLYNPLAQYGADAQIELVLAEEISPNPAATEWTIRVHKGVHFHDGKELTAADVLFTLNRIAFKSQGEGAGEITALNLKAAKKMDKYTLRIPCTTPFSILDGVLAGFYFNIVPVGFDLKSPVGTGPYKFKSFTPGTESTFIRNDDYWQDHLPYTDSIVITNYSDATSQTNAILSGQVDLVNNLTADQIAVLQGGGKKTLISPSGGWTPFIMRADQDPWKDNRVREAMRLIVDRPQMLEVVFGGHGTLGNDVFGIWDPEYDHSLPQRVQDIEKAQSLLKSAGQENLKVTLTTGDFAQGTLKSAQVLAEQAASAGVDIKLAQTPTSQYFGPNWLSWNFAQDYWNWYTYLVQAAQVTGPHAQYDESHFSNPKYNSLFKQAVGTTDKSKQTELVHEMQKIDYEEGAYIIPNFPPIIDGYASNVNGLVPSKNGISFNNYDLKAVWFS
jgi:peptide/nickel transport system substrate-binding protein